MKATNGLRDRKRIRSSLEMKNSINYSTCTRGKINVGFMDVRILASNP
jgi:hypothetical protein